MTDEPSKKMSSHCEIPRYIESDFQDLVPIAEDNESTICQGKLKDLGRVAINLFVGSKTYENEEKEIEFLITHRHPNIAHLFGVLWDGIDSSRYLGYVMEYVEGGTLHNVIHDTTKSYDLPQFYDWVEQIARGLQFLHRNEIIHGDLKPQNVLVNRNFLKLSGFGITKDYFTRGAITSDSNNYVAPELLMYDRCITASDIFSLAVTIWEIFHRSVPHSAQKYLIRYYLMGKIFEPAIDLDKMEHDVQQLVRRCLQLEPEARPGIEEIVGFFERKGASCRKVELQKIPGEEKNMENIGLELEGKRDEGQLAGPSSAFPLELQALSSEPQDFAEVLEAQAGSSKDSDISHLRSLAMELCHFSRKISIVSPEEPSLLAKMQSMSMEKGGSEKSLEVASDYAMSSSELDREYDDFHENTILLIGGMRNSLAEYAGLTILNCDRNKWTESLLELPYEARGSGAVYLDEEIYLFGGFNNPRALFKLNNNLKWIQLADMNIERRWITNSCLVWDGCIWVFGGKEDDTKKLKSVEKYDPKEDKWTLMPEMNYPRSGAAAELWKNGAIITGGFSDSGRTNSVEFFEEKWIDLPDLPTSLSDHSLFFYADELLIIGGHNGEICSDAFEIFPPTDFWNPLQPMKFPASHFGGIILDREIYAIGGCEEQCQPQDRVEIFNGNSWRDGPALPYKGAYMSAVIIPQILGNRISAYKP